MAQNQNQNQRQPTAEIHQEIRTETTYGGYEEIIYIRRVRHKTNSTNNSNYPSISKRIMNSNYVKSAKQMVKKAYRKIKPDD